MQKTFNILISNLHPDTEEEELQEMIEEFGEVSDLKFFDEPDPVLETYAAVVTMLYEDDAEDAIENIHGKRWMELRLEVDWYDEKKDASRLKENDDFDDWTDYSGRDEKGKSKSSTKRPRGFRNS